MILESLYFFLPGYIANMAPVLLRWIPVGGTPINEKLFGSHKTWRGLIVGIIMGGIIFSLQKYLYVTEFKLWAIIDYGDFSPVLGFLMGLGALVGDAVKSYYKRKGGLKPGERWFPYDQIDFVIGGIIFSWFVYVPQAEVVLILLLVTPILHIVVNHIGYWLRIRESKW